MSHEELPFAISPKDAVAHLNDSNFIFIDVRESYEWEAGHLAHAHFLPLSTATPEDFDAFPKDKRWIIVCRSGNRSASVTHFLREKGLTNVQNLDQGMIGLNLYLPEKLVVR